MVLASALVIAVVAGLVESSSPGPAPSPGSSTANDEPVDVAPSAAKPELPAWFAPMPGSVAEVRVLAEDDGRRTGTIVLSGDAELEEVMEFYRRRLLAAGFVVVGESIRPGVAALLAARHWDGSRVSLVVVPDATVIRFDEP